SRCANTTHRPPDRSHPPADRARAQVAVPLLPAPPRLRELRFLPLLPLLPLLLLRPIPRLQEWRNKGREIPPALATEEGEWRNRPITASLAWWSVPEPYLRPYPATLRATSYPRRQEEPSPLAHDPSQAETPPAVDECCRESIAR